MLSKQRAALLIACAALVLVPAGLALHAHEADVQAAGHVDCDACHFRHLSGVVFDAAPAPSAPALVAHAVGSPAAHREQGVAIGICPTRGPPA